MKDSRSGAMSATIPEQIGVAHIGLQHVHRFVPRHVPHLEYRGAAAGGFALPPNYVGTRVHGGSKHAPRGGACEHPHTVNALSIHASAPTR
jgi:hypothetical protein